MTTRSYRLGGFLRAHTYRSAPAITRKKKLSSRSIGAISSIPTRGVDGGKERERRRERTSETMERKTILSRRRNSYRFFGWRAGWRAISCQSACPGKGGPFIRNRLKAQINKPCRRRFILHITSVAERKKETVLRAPVSSYYRLETASGSLDLTVTDADVCICINIVTRTRPPLVKTM